MKFLPFTEYEKRQKSIDSNSKLALMSSMMKIKTDVIAKKKRAKAGFSGWCCRVQHDSFYMTHIIKISWKPYPRSWRKKETMHFRRWNSRKPRNVTPKRSNWILDRGFFGQIEPNAEMLWKSTKKPSRIVIQHSRLTQNAARLSNKKEIHWWDWVVLMIQEPALNLCVNLVKALWLTLSSRNLMIYRNRLKVFEYTICVSYKLDTKLIFLIFHPIKSTQN